MFVVSKVGLARHYRRLAVALLSVALLPWAPNLLHNIEVGGFARIDLSSSAFNGGVPVWGLFHERLVDLATVAGPADVLQCLL